MQGITSNLYLPKICIFRPNIARTANATYTAGATIPFIKEWGNDDIAYAENGLIKFTRKAKIFYEFIGTFYADTNGRTWIGLLKDGVRVATSLEYNSWTTLSLMLPLDVDTTTTLTLQAIERTSLNHTGVGLQNSTESYLACTTISVLENY